MANKAIFMDRDGVICEDPGHLWKIEDFKLISGVIEALRELSKTEYKLIIITNQAVIGRGMCREEDYHILNDYILALLTKHGITIEKTYFCPHHPDKGLGKYKVDCECRKPKIGMFLQAAKDFNLDLTKCFLVGDKTSDILAGKNAGCKTILVRTGYKGEDKLFDVKADFVVGCLGDILNLVESDN